MTNCYWTDWTGACRKLHILDETISGKYVVSPLDSHDIGGLTMFIVNKEDVVIENDKGDSMEGITK